jgi:hypothetical protein
MGSYSNDKKSCISLLKATHAGSWDKMSREEKFKIFENDMVLRKAIGQKTWVNPYKRS